MAGIEPATDGLRNHVTLFLQLPDFVIVTRVQLLEEILEKA